MKDFVKTGWSVLPLGSACEAVSTGPFGSLLGKKDYVEDGVPVVNPIDIVGGLIQPDSIKRVTAETSERLANYRMRPGDIVVARRGVLGRCARVTEESAGWLCGTGSFFIRPGDLLSAEFLARYIDSPTAIEYFEAASTGATMPNISNKTLSGLSIPLPPLEEQQRIVAVLDEAFEGLARARAHAEANLQNARELFGSELASVCKAHAEEYGTVSLAEISEEITDGDHMPPPKSQEGVPFVTIKNIDKETHDIDFSDTFKVPESYYQELKDKRKPRVGDVLYTVTGSFGIPVLVQAGQRFCFQRHIGLIRPKRDISPEWLYFVLVSPFVFEQADAGATGTAQRTVSLKLLRSMAVPSVPLELQTVIAARFRGIYSEASRLAVSYQAKLQDLDDLRQSLLQKAFAGELT